MTEAEWLKCDDLVPMLEFLNGKASDRKMRLFAVTCCEWVTQLGTDTPFRSCLEVAERFADGAATTTELQEVYQAFSEVYLDCEQERSEAGCRAILDGTSRQGDDPALVALQDAADIVCRASDPFFRDDFAYTARYCGKTYTQTDPIIRLRDIFGNPFRPVTFSPSWRTDTVLDLARRMYESRDFGAMPILADALQDAGCEEEAILSHCRQPGEDVRGCWVVDLVLGRG